MKSVWDGSLSFGLVNIPVRLYPAIESQALGFRLLHSKCHTPLKYKRWCPKCKVEVTWDEVVKGIEIRKGEYYVLTNEDMEELKPEKTDTIEIVEFIDAQQIDPIYFNNHYYIAPKVAKEKAFFLFKEVLQLTAKAAIGRFVMREKQYVCAIESYKRGLLLTTLNYRYEIRDIDKIPELKIVPKLKKEELTLAKKIIHKLYKEEFDMGEFKDTFAEELKKMLELREKGKIVKVGEVGRVKGKGRKKEKTLIDILKASLKQA